MVGGDFNIKLFTSKKCGGSNLRDPFQKIMEIIISEWDLLNVVPKKWEE